MLYMNIEGLITAGNNKRKISYLREKCKVENFKLLFFTESHLTSDILDEEINVEDFIFRLHIYL